MAPGRICTIACLLAICGVLTKATPQESRLLTDLFSRYEKSYCSVVAPSKSFEVQFGLALTRASFDSKEETITANFFQEATWTDPRLTWDPKDYDGIEHIRVPASFLWKPDIVPYNNVGDNKVDQDVNIVLYNTGVVLWIPKAEVTVDCPVEENKVCDPDNSDCANSKGTCTATFRYGSWTFDGNRLNIQLYNKLKAMDTSEYKDRKGLRLVSTSAVRIDKKYDCCEEPYPRLDFTAIFEVL